MPSWKKMAFQNLEHSSMLLSKPNSNTVYGGRHLLSSSVCGKGDDVLFSTKLQGTMRLNHGIASLFPCTSAIGKSSLYESLWDSLPFPCTSAIAKSSLYESLWQQHMGSMDSNSKRKLSPFIVQEVAYYWVGHNMLRGSLIGPLGRQSQSQVILTFTSTCETDCLLFFAPFCI